MHGKSRFQSTRRLPLCRASAACYRHPRLIIRHPTPRPASSCGTRVSPACETFDFEQNEGVAEVFRHSAVCHEGFQPARVRRADGGDDPIERGDSVEVSWLDDDSEEHWASATVAARLRTGNYDLDVDFAAANAPDPDRVAPPVCSGGMACPYRSQYHGLHAVECEDGSWSLYILLRKVHWGDPNAAAEDSSDNVDSWASPTEFRACDECARSLGGKVPEARKWALMNTHLQIVPPVRVSNLLVDTGTPPPPQLACHLSPAAAVAPQDTPPSLLSSRG